MSVASFIVMIFAINFGFLLGVWWATARRENWLRQHQPYRPQGLDLDDLAYARLAPRVHGGEAL